MALVNLWHSLPPDRQAFDEVHISTVPRFKQSGLSGDEWRISAQVELKRKGRVIAIKHFRNVDTAVRYLDYFMNVEIAESGACDLGHEAYKYLCDQEGCQLEATTFYQLKTEYCNEGHKKTAFADLSYRQFCELHKHRGDASMEDQDSNYIEIPDPKEPN